MNELLLFFALCAAVTIVVGLSIWLDDRNEDAELHEALTRVKIDLSDEERELLRWGGEP